MYELPMAFDIIPNLPLEGAALVEGLTRFLTIWAVLFAVIFLVVIPLVCRDAGASRVSDAEQPDGALRRAA